MPPSKNPRKRVPDRARPTLPQRPTESGPGRGSEAPALTAVEKLRRAAKDVMNRYKYKRVDAETARLLIVHPRSDHPSEIFVTLKEVPFADLGESEAYAYEALSYHWGSGDPERSIMVSDDRTLTTNVSAVRDFHDIVGLVQAVNKPIWVKPNLYRALQHLRHDTRPVTLWVDALCINQEDLDEKKAQVANMAYIYSQADNVLVWLGDGDERTIRAMSFIDEVIKLEGLKELIADETRIGYWADLLYIMRSSWFSRRWVIQELALAQNATVHCGGDTVHWFDFRDAISLFDQNYDSIKNLLKRSPQYDHDHDALGELDSLGAKVLVDTINNIFRADHAEVESEPIQSLEFLVSKLCTFEASDPRDTVHALRNIARETGRNRRAGSDSNTNPPPSPDYTKDLLTVYTDFIRWVYVKTRKIDIICRHWAIPERKKEESHNLPLIRYLPSWIKQISDAPFGRQEKIMRGRIHGDSFVGLPGEGTYNASYGREARVQFGADDSDAHAETKLGPNPAATRTATQLGDNKPFMQNAEETCAGAEDSRVQDAIDSVSFGGPSGRHRKETLPDAVSEPRTNNAEMPVSPRTKDGLSATNGAHSQVPAANGDAYSEMHGETSAQGETGDQAPAEPNQNGAEACAHTGPLLPTTGSSAADERNPHKTAQKLNTPLDLRKGININATLANGTHTPTDNKDSPTEEARRAQHETGRDASIVVDGLHLATLTWVTDPIPDGVIPSNALRRLRGGSGESSGDTVTDKLWRTLVAERGADGRNPPAWYYRACSYCLVHDSPNGHINTSELLKKTQPDIVRDFLKRVQAVTWNRRFLEADPANGQDPLHGLAPQNALQKDLVCILFGCSVPVILRHHEDDKIGDYYTLQGEAYMYGFMDGEAVLSRTEEEIKRETKSFRIL